MARGGFLYIRRYCDRVTPVRCVEALERKKEEQEAYGEIETEHPGYLGSQDTFYVCPLKGVGRVYQQTFVDTYQKKHPVFFGQ